MHLFSHCAFSCASSINQIVCRNSCIAYRQKVSRRFVKTCDTSDHWGGCKRSCTAYISSMCTLSICSTHILVTSRGGIGNYSSWIFWPRYEPKKMANLRYEHLDTKYIKWGLTCWYTLQHILCHRNFILGDSFEKSRYFLGLKAKAWGWSKDRVELSLLPRRVSGGIACFSSAQPPWPPPPSNWMMII